MPFVGLDLGGSSRLLPRGRATQPGSSAAGMSQEGPRYHRGFLYHCEMLLKRTDELPSFLRARCPRDATFQIARVMTTPCPLYACTHACVYA